MRHMSGLLSKKRILPIYEQLVPDIFFCSSGAFYNLPSSLLHMLINYKILQYEKTNSNALSPGNTFLKLQ